MSAETGSHAVGGKGRTDRLVLVIGGSGGMSERYRDVVAKRGGSLRHYETRVPSGVRHSTGNIALVVIMVTMVSHALLDQVHRMGVDDAHIVYLRSASVSALRAAIDQRLT